MTLKSKCRTNKTPVTGGFTWWRDWDRTNDLYRVNAKHTIKRTIKYNPEHRVSDLFSAIYIIGINCDTLSFRGGFSPVFPLDSPSEKRMAETKQNRKLDTKTARLKIKYGTEAPSRIAPNQYLIYRKPQDGSAGKWLAQLYNPLNGKKPKKVLGTADDGSLVADGSSVLTYYQAQAEAVKWFRLMERQARIEAEGGEIIDATGFTVGDALTAYFREKERPNAKGAKGLKNAKSSANAWIIPEIGNIPLTKLTKARINDWLDFVASSGRRISGRPGPPPQTDEERRKRRDTANRVLSILKAALTLAYNENDSLAEEISPCWQRVRLFEGASQARPRFLKEEEEIRLINVCQPDFRELVIAALETGCRYGELTKLRVKDYNPDTEIPSIYIADSKSGKPRYVDLGSERGIALFDDVTARKRNPNDLIFTHKVKRLTRGDTRLLKSYTEKRLERARLPREEQAELILEGFEDAWRSSDQKKRMKDACKRAGIEPIGFHGLRHSYASMLIRGGASLTYVAAQLGHGDTRMVEKYYGHLAPDDKARAIRAAMAGRKRLDNSKIQNLKLQKPKIG